MSTSSPSSTLDSVAYFGSHERIQRGIPSPKALGEFWACLATRKLRHVQQVRRRKFDEK